MSQGDLGDELNNVFYDWVASQGHRLIPRGCVWAIKGGNGGRFEQSVSVIIQSLLRSKSTDPPATDHDRRFVPISGPLIYTQYHLWSSPGK